MNVMGRMLCEVVYMRLAEAFDDNILSVVRLELGLSDLPAESEEGQKRSRAMMRVYRDAWKRLGEEVGTQLLTGPRYLHAHSSEEEPSEPEEQLEFATVSRLGP